MNKFTDNSGFGDEDCDADCESDSDHEMKMNTDTWKSNYIKYIKSLKADNLQSPLTNECLAKHKLQFSDDTIELTPDQYLDKFSRLVDYVHCSEDYYSSILIGSDLATLVITGLFPYKKQPPQFNIRSRDETYIADYGCKIEPEESAYCVNAVDMIKDAIAKEGKQSQLMGDIVYDPSNQDLSTGVIHFSQIMKFDLPLQHIID